MALLNAQMTFDLSGLAGFKPAKARQITLKAVRAGAKLVQATAKQNAPRKSGVLKQSMGIKAIKGNRGKTLAMAIIGARKSVSKMVKRGRGNKLFRAVPAFYAHLVEKGTQAHSIRKGSKIGRKGKPSVGQQVIAHPGAKAKPFLGPAWETTRDRAISTGMAVMSAEIFKAIAKGN